MIKKEAKSHPFVKLTQHIESLFYYNENFKEYRDDKGKESYDQLEEVIYWHDYGKQNKYFQSRITNLELKIKTKRNKRKDKHAVLSSLKYMEKGLRGDVTDLENINMILGHHGRLQNYSILLDKLYGYIDDDDILESLNTIEDTDHLNLRDKFGELEDMYYANEDSILNDITKAVQIRDKFSRLVDADRLSAMRKSIYHESDLIERKFNKEAHYYKLNKINNADKNNPLVKLRNDIKIDETAFLQRDSGVFSLVLPTGLGKTLSSIDLAEKNKNKVIYVVPYLSIADQTWEVLNDIYKHRDYKGVWDFLVKHDSRMTENDYFSDDAQISIKDMVTSWRSKIIVTTTVQFFESIISVWGTKLRKLHNTYGATILIDEPQSIPYNKWTFLKGIVAEMAKELKWKVIYLSATPPTMSEDTIPLIKNENYLFKQLNRTSIKFHGRTTGFKAIKDWTETALNLTKDNDRILFLVNMEKGARKIYHYVTKNVKDREVHFISGKLPAIVRMYKLEQIKRCMERGDKILVVSTQVLEAGVDLDFDGVVRDLAPLPVLIQVAGRLNRKWERNQESVHVLQLIEDSVYSDFEFRHTGEVLQKFNLEIQEKDYYDACKLYYELCEEMPPQEVHSVWREEFISLAEPSMVMIEEMDYQANVPCINLSEWLALLQEKNKELARDFLEFYKSVTQFEFTDTLYLINELMELESKGIYSKEDYLRLKDLGNQISWLNTNCSKSDVTYAVHNGDVDNENGFNKAVMKIPIELLVSFDLDDYYEKMARIDNLMNQEDLYLI